MCIIIQNIGYAELHSTLSVVPNGGCEGKQSSRGFMSTALVKEKNKSI